MTQRSIILPEERVQRADFYLLISLAEPKNGSINYSVCPSAVFHRREKPDSVNMMSTCWHSHMFPSWFQSFLIKVSKPTVHPTWRDLIQSRHWTWSAFESSSGFIWLKDFLHSLFIHLSVFWEQKWNILCFLCKIPLFHSDWGATARGHAHGMLLVHLRANMWKKNPPHTHG